MPRAAAQRPAALPWACRRRQHSFVAWPPPQGADLDRHASPGAVFAGYHYDLNFLTIHGKSRYPGLSIWLRGGRRVPVRIPDGCLLIQAGKQMEWLTGGHIRAGFHEVSRKTSCRRRGLQAGGGPAAPCRLTPAPPCPPCRPPQVVCTEDTVRAAEAARREGRPPWRVSSTVFSQVASDEVLRPLPPFASPAAEAAYPAVAAGKYVQDELEAINLRAVS